MLPSTVTPAQTFTLPKPPSGDAAAARRLAEALRRCASDVTTAQRLAHGVLADARAHWSGSAASVATHPLADLDLQTQAVDLGLRDTADRLEDYAHALDNAHHQHHWSLGRILTVAAVVAVTTTAVVVTVGLATPEAAAVDAAVVSAEVTTTTAAVEAAGLAGSEAAQAVGLAVRALSLLRPVAAFLKPQVYVTAGLTDYEAYQQIRDTGHLHAAPLVEHATEGLVLGSVVGGAAKGAQGLLTWLSPRLAEAVGYRLAPRGFESLVAVDRFSGLLHDGLARAGFGTTEAALQGSAVTGVKFTTGAAFDLGRLSDFDVALGGEDLLAAAKRAGVKLRSRGVRTAPLTLEGDEEALVSLGLRELVRELSEVAGRDVHLMIYRDLELARARGPHVDLAR